MATLYLTHCSADKDDTLKDTGAKVTPDRLYTSDLITRFMRACQAQSVDWAIFSDYYGIVFAQDEIEWYTQDPDAVSEQNYRRLVEHFVARTAGYDQVAFYRHPKRLHPFFQRVLTAVQERGVPATLFTDLGEIGET